LDRLGIPADAPAGVANELRRDYLPLWLPEALAEILSAICALGGAKVEAREIVDNWMDPDECDNETDRVLEDWITRMGAKDNGGEK
jgi:hypothetical protein